MKVKEKIVETLSFFLPTPLPSYLSWFSIHVYNNLGVLYDTSIGSALKKQLLCSDWYLLPNTYIFSLITKKNMQLFSLAKLVCMLFLHTDSIERMSEKAV